jgi:hypothetical protein
MDEKRRDDDETPETAEPPEAEQLSEKVPDEVSGEGATPLGSTDDHSDAPGETGTGSREGDPEHGKPYRQ